MPDDVDLEPLREAAHDRPGFESALTCKGHVLGVQDLFRKPLHLWDDFRVPFPSLENVPAGILGITSNPRTVANR